MDATDGEHPEGTTVQSSVFREIGVFGKQVSAFASALAFRTTINGSIFFNGPRAGINWNDGSECSSACISSSASHSLTHDRCRGQWEEAMPSHKTSCSTGSARQAITEYVDR